MTTGPATKHQKGKPGKGSPRLEKKKKKKEKKKLALLLFGELFEKNSYICTYYGFVLAVGVGFFLKTVEMVNHETQE